MKGVNTKKAKAEFEARKALDQDEIKKLFGAKKAEAERMAQGGVNFALFNYIMTVHDFKHCANLMEAVRLMYKLMFLQVNRLQNEALLMASCFTDEQLEDLGIKRDHLDLQANAVRELEKYKVTVRKRAKSTTYVKDAKKKGLIV